MWYDRPTEEFFVVKGINPKNPSSFMFRVYGETATEDGAKLLSEEATREGWERVHYQKRYRSI